MDSMQVSLMVLGLILVVGVQTGSGIKCYVCNSAYPEKGDDCKDPSTKIFIKNCAEHHADRGLNYTYCRKTLQTVGDDYRVIRACASKARLDRECIERTGSRGIKMKYCECEGDACNTAPQTFPVSGLLLSVLSGLLALIYHS